MKMHFKNTFLLVAFALVFTIGYAQTPRELRGIDGMSYPDALRELRDEGYKLSNTSSSNGHFYQTFWNSRRGVCVTMHTYRNEIRSIRETPNGDCHKDRRGNELSGSRRWKNDDDDNDRYYHSDRENRYGRHDNDRHHDDRYSYGRGEVKVYDLVGRGATWAYDELRDRGFTEQKNHQNDGKTYRVFYNFRTHQCIKTLSKNKKIASIQNSTHCNN